MAAVMREHGPVEPDGGVQPVHRTVVGVLAPPRAGREVDREGLPSHVHDQDTCPVAFVQSVRADTRTGRAAGRRPPCDLTFIQLQPAISPGQQATQGQVELMAVEGPIRLDLGAAGQSPSQLRSHTDEFDFAEPTFIYPQGQQTGHVVETRRGPGVRVTIAVIDAIKARSESFHALGHRLVTFQTQPDKDFGLVEHGSPLDADCLNHLQVRWHGFRASLRLENQWPRARKREGLTTRGTYGVA